MSAKRSKILVVLLSLCVIGAGAVFAQVQNKKFSGPADQTYYMCTFVSGVEYWVAAFQGFKDAAKQLGGKAIYQGAAEYDLNKFVTVYEQISGKNPAGIALSPIDDAGFVEPVKAAMGRKIPIVVFASNTSTDKVAFVTSDNVKEGQFAARTLGKALGGKGKVMVTRNTQSNHQLRVNTFIETIKAEFPGIAHCPAYGGSICSLCCTLDARCFDACKPGSTLDDCLETLAKHLLPSSLDISVRLRILRFTMLFLSLSIMTGIFIGIISYEDLLTVSHTHFVHELLLENFIKTYMSILVFIGLCTWWLILNNESRRIAHHETAKQTQSLLTEIEEHKRTDAKLQKALTQADTANTAKSRFLSNMSHEIRSPLNSIIGYAYILENDPSIPAHRQQAVKTLKRSSEHLSALIEDILDITRIEARKFELKYMPINCPVFMDHLVHIYKEQAEEKGLTFYCQTSAPREQQ